MVTKVTINSVTNNRNNHIQLCPIVIITAPNCTSNNHSYKNIRF